jgi:hypothetical protein
MQLIDDVKQNILKIRKVSSIAALFHAFRCKSVPLVATINSIVQVIFYSNVG